MATTAKPAQESRLYGLDDAEWLAQIEPGEAHPTDETLRNEGQGYTATAAEKRFIC